MRSLRCFDFGELGSAIEMIIDKGLPLELVVSQVGELGFSRENILSSINAMNDALVIFQIESVLYVTRYMDSTLLDYFKEEAKLISILKEKNVFHPNWNAGKSK